MFGPAKCQIIFSRISGWPTVPRVRGMAEKYVLLVELAKPCFPLCVGQSLPQLAIKRKIPFKQNREPASESVFAAVPQQFAYNIWGRHAAYFVHQDVNNDFGLFYRLRQFDECVDALLDLELLVIAMSVGLM